MTYFNNLGQGRVGWRSPGGGVTPTTLWSSIYSVWNADALGTSLDTSIYAAYNGDNVNDSSGNSRNGTNVNNVTFTTGKVGNAFTFNGSNYVSLPTNSLSLTSFSFNFWIFNPSAQSNTIFSDYGNDGQQKGIYIDLTNGNSHTIRLVAFNNSTNYTVVSAGGNSGFINRWSMATITFSGTSVNIYLDGSLVSTGTMPNAINYVASSFPCIGAFKSNNGTPSGYLSSGTKLDAFTIWNRALTANEVLSLYNAGTGAEYPFSSQLLPSPNDSVSANHGTLMNGATFTDGKIGKAFTFDGVNDYVKLPNNSLNFTGDFTISAWVNFSSFPSVSTIIANYYRLPPYAVYYGWSVLMISNQIAFDIFTGVNNSSVRLLSPSIPTNTWKHVTFIHKKNVSLSIYIDGVLSTTTITTTPIGYSGNETPAIGGTLPGDGFQYPTNGKIDAVNVWQRELTSTEITSLYNAGTGKQYPNY